MPYGDKLGGVTESCIGQFLDLWKWAYEVELKNSSVRLRHDGSFFILELLLSVITVFSSVSPLFHYIKEYNLA